MFDKMQHKGMTAVAIIAALCGFASTVTATTGKQLDVLASTSTPNYIGGVSDINVANGDYVTANMFVGNWFGFEVGMTDVTGTNPSFPQYAYSIALRCSNNVIYTLNLTTRTTMINGAEGVLPCPAGAGTAQSSVHFIAYN
jgi:hypothetical protein